MNFNYIKSRSFIKPDIIDSTSSKKVVYIRRDITEIEEEGKVFYEYEEAKISKEEYDKYLMETNIIQFIDSIENLKNENKSLNKQIDILTSCILEMSEIIYN